MKNIYFKLFAFLISSQIHLYAQSNATQDDWHKHHLHEAIASHTYDAFTVEAVLTNDLLSNISGGLQQGSSILGNFDLTLEVDSKKLGLWSGGTLFAYVLGDYNTKQGMTSYAGDFQTSSNIEAVETLRLYELWYQHEFSDQTSVLFGLHDYNSEFNALEYGALYTNSSFGIEPDISQVGPSIFPNAALSLRIASKLSKTAYILGTLNDGIVGNPNNDRITAIQWNKDEGFFTSIEVGISDFESYDKDYYKLALGAWYHSAKLANFAGVIDNKNAGIYLIGEATLWKHEEKALGGFFQVGLADDKRNIVSTYIGTGANYKGLFKSRPDDLLGFAIANAIASQNYKNFSGVGTDSFETTIELTYQGAFNSHLIIQPDIQYVINPSFDKTIDNALIVGARVSFTY